MGSQIYEVRGRGPLGSPAMAHLVDIGAHDGHGRGITRRVKIKPNQLRQRMSWFSHEGLAYYEGGNPVIAVIYFPYADATIDSMSDKIALDALIAHLRFTLIQGSREELEFIGHADSRGSAAFNQILAAKRAKQVQNYVDRRISTNEVERLQHVRYKSFASSMGESYATGDHDFDRRVDVVLRSRTDRQNVSFHDEPALVPGDYKGPLTRKLQFRGYAGVSVSIFGLIGAETLELEIRNPRTGKSAFYQYFGPNIGTPSPIPIGVGLPDSGYTDKEIPLGFGMVDVDDFAGPGGVLSASVGKSGSTLIFSGPKMEHTKKVIRKNGWEVFMDGWSVQFPGGSGGVGYWYKLPYNSIAERDKAVREAQERQRKGQEIHDRYGPPI